ncbi:ABC TRANSPORTER G FAMILY MEMBER 16 [Salix koriyanagi]|uniref:ABC TRANSPORTER G FAMILY MEMBER 16 n=1 Tax=Salix koriyanagi TaxID=2511006 RepID=A0A9Q0U3U6_9ROSI|nr:ABC TRANSPORTER G FAMILY MEMBER 16 [Salix koriyanagi]
MLMGHADGISGPGSSSNHPITYPESVLDDEDEEEQILYAASFEELASYACSSMPPSNPFVLSFNNLTYSVKVGPKMPFSVCGKADPSPGSSETASTKVLLNDISGEAREGEIMAVLGASGSGKSTLIDALADRIAKESLKGSVTLNGEVLESRLLKVISAYVMQDDLLFPMLTVEETLMFSAEFRLPRSLSRSKKKARVQALIDQLGLRNAANTVIGDEGHRGSLPEFFGQFGHPIPENENRIELALDLIRELEEAPDGTKTLVEFNKSWQTMKNPMNRTRNVSKLSLKDAISASISRGKLVSGAPNNSILTSSVPTFANPLWTEMMVLSKRSLLNAKRMPELFGIRLGAVLVTGIILATVFYHLDNSPRGAQERLSFFAFAMSTTYYTCAESIPAFLQERYIFMRETAYNAYRRSSYVLAHSLISIPSLIVLSIAFAATTFWAVGLDGGFSGFCFFFFTILSAFWAGSSFVTFLSGVVSHVMLGFTVVVAILAYFLLFSGFFISRDRIPSYWLWFHYISLVKYPYEAALQNEFHDPAKCFVRGVQMFDTTPLAAVPLALKLKMLKSISSTLGMNITSNTCMVTGTDILRQQGITDISKWNCLWITIAWGFFFRILFYFALLLGSNNKRR